MAFDEWTGLADHLVAVHRLGPVEHLHLAEPGIVGEPFEHPLHEAHVVGVPDAVEVGPADGEGGRVLDLGGGLGGSPVPPICVVLDL